MNNTKHINDYYVKKLSVQVAHQINSSFVCAVGIKNTILLNLGFEVIKNIPIERIKKKASSYEFRKTK